VGDAIMISERPPAVEDRAIPGHWEGDLILGLHSSAIGTLVERSSRFTMLLHLPRPEGHQRGQRVKNGPPLAGHGAEAVRTAIVQSMSELPGTLRQSLTWDQGAEMAQHVRLRIESGLEIYFFSIHKASGSAARTKTPMSSCASTSRKAPISAGIQPKSWPQSPTR